MRIIRKSVICASDTGVIRETRPPDLTVSIISADNLDLLLPCLRSVFEATHRITLDVFVVDNASTDGTAEAVMAEFPQVKVIRNAQRLGFSTNNNLVLRQGQGRYLMLLNDDTVVLDGALDELVAFMDAHPEAGAVGSYLLNPDCSLQVAFADFPQPVMEAIRPATSWTLHKARREHEPFEVDSVCGAAMLVRREVIEQVGFWTPPSTPSTRRKWIGATASSRAVAHLCAAQSRIIHYGSVTMNRAVPRKYELLLSHKCCCFASTGQSGSQRLSGDPWLDDRQSKWIWWTRRSLVDQRYAEPRTLHWYLLKRVPRL